MKRTFTSYVFQLRGHSALKAGGCNEKKGGHEFDGGSHGKAGYSISGHENFGEIRSVNEHEHSKIEYLYENNIYF